MLAKNHCLDEAGSTLAMQPHDNKQSTHAVVVLDDLPQDEAAQHGHDSKSDLLHVHAHRGSNIMHPRKKLPEHSGTFLQSIHAPEHSQTY